jgi:methylphosphotriester-DNA--protein-cysteine methyltransferase
MIDFHPHSDPCYRCKATAWEAIGEFVPSRGKPQDVVACAFCGVRLRVEAAAVPFAAKQHTGTATEFRFQYGRFKGMTFAEAEAEPNGRRYLEHLRETNEKLKDRLTEYLEHAAPSA